MKPPRWLHHPWFRVGDELEVFHMPSGQRIVRPPLDPRWTAPGVEVRAILERLKR